MCFQFNDHISRFWFDCFFVLFVDIFLGRIFCCCSVLSFWSWLLECGQEIGDFIHHIPSSNTKKSNVCLVYDSDLLMHQWIINSSVERHSLVAYRREWMWPTEPSAPYKLCLNVWDRSFLGLPFSVEIEAVGFSEITINFCRIHGGAPKSLATLRLSLLSPNGRIKWGSVVDVVTFRLTVFINL
jgi:hypothetical protein